MLNLAVLIGRLTADPTVRYNNDMAVARFTLAVDRQKSQKNQDPGADFISIVCFGKTAELVEKYLGKGRKVAVQGRIQTGSYEAKDGSKRYTTDIVADRVEFLDRAGEAEPTPSRGAENKNVKPAEDDYQVGFTQLTDEDIPFGG